MQVDLMELFLKLESKMKSKKVIKKSCLLFGEGRGSEKRFFEFLERSYKWTSLYETNWSMHHDFASGSSAKTILNACLKSAYNIEYNLILCFIDLDDLKHDYENSYLEEREKIDIELTAMCSEEKMILVVWQEENLEDELSRIVGRKVKKNRVKQELKNHNIKIINSNFAKNIFSYFN
jgi:hypothetical protein